MILSPLIEVFDPLIACYLPDSGEQFAAASGTILDVELQHLELMYTILFWLNPGLVYSELVGAASAYRVVLMYIAPWAGGENSACTQAAGGGVSMEHADNKNSPALGPSYLSVQAKHLPTSTKCPHWLEN